jgi:hypothetical protein
MNTATLRFIESKNTCAFEAREFPIEFVRPPVIGEAFIFTKLAPFREPCNLSQVQKVEVSDHTYRLTTRNSVYEIEL